MLAETGNLPLVDGWRIILFGSAQLIPPYTLVPRFILSLRKLYARDLQGRRGSDIDTAFGLTPVFTHGADLSAIVFADDGQNKEEEIEMEVRGAGSSGV